MSNPELSRTGCRDFKVRACDRVDVWTSPFGEDRWNLTIETGHDEYGQLRLLGFNTDQFASLLSQITDALGRMPEITRQQVKQCHDMLGQLLQESKTTDESDDPPELDMQSDW